MAGKIALWKTELTEPDHMRKWKAGKTNQLNSFGVSFDPKEIFKNSEKTVEPKTETT
jgi:hypothetical protein